MRRLDLGQRRAGLAVAGGRGIGQRREVIALGPGLGGAGRQGLPPPGRIGPAGGPIGLLGGGGLAAGGDAVALGPQPGHGFQRGDLADPGGRERLARPVHPGADRRQVG